MLYRYSHYPIIGRSPPRSTAKPEYGMIYTTPGNGNVTSEHFVLGTSAIQLCACVLIHFARSIPQDCTAPRERAISSMRGRRLEDGILPLCAVAE